MVKIPVDKNKDKNEPIFFEQKTRLGTETVRASKEGNSIVIRNFKGKIVTKKKVASENEFKEKLKQYKENGTLKDNYKQERLNNVYEIDVEFDYFKKQDFKEDKKYYVVAQLDVKDKTFFGQSQPFNDYRVREYYRQEAEDSVFGKFHQYVANKAGRGMYHYEADIGKTYAENFDPAYKLYFFIRYYKNV